MATLLGRGTAIVSLPQYGIRRKVGYLSLARRTSSKARVFRFFRRNQHSRSGGGKNSREDDQGGATAAERTIESLQSLKCKEEMLEKRRSVLERRVNDELSKAKSFTAKNNKNDALFCLRRKKLHEKEIEQVDVLIMRVMEQQSMLESSASTMQAFSALQDAAKAQKATMSEFNLDNVDSVLEEIVQVSDDMQMVQDALGTPLGAEYDADDLEAELEIIEMSELDKHLPSVPKTQVQPQPLGREGRPEVEA